jgi:hypothetical protein
MLNFYCNSDFFVLLCFVLIAEMTVNGDPFVRMIWNAMESPRQFAFSNQEHELQTLTSTRVSTFAELFVSLVLLFFFPLCKASRLFVAAHMQF